MSSPNLGEDERMSESRVGGWDTDGAGYIKAIPRATHESFFLLFSFLSLISGPDSPLDAVHTLHYVIAINMYSDNNCFISLM